jgi:hypothetical protein
MDVVSPTLYISLFIPLLVDVNVAQQNFHSMFIRVQIIYAIPILRHRPRLYVMQHSPTLLFCDAIFSDLDFFLNVLI